MVCSSLIYGLLLPFVVFKLFLLFDIYHKKDTTSVIKRQKSFDEIATAPLALKKILSSTNILQLFKLWFPYGDRKIVPVPLRTAIGQGHFLPISIMIGSMTENTRLRVKKY